MQLEKIKASYSSIILIAVLLASSLLATYMVVNVGIIIGPLIVISLAGILILAWTIKEYKISIYLMYLLCVFMPFLNRVLGLQIQFGIALDILSGLAFLVMLYESSQQKTDWSLLKSPITYGYITICVYQLLQVFNPNAVSIVAWLVGLRGYTVFLLFIVFFHLFRKFEEVKKFTIFWLTLGLIIALYGIYQEIFGLNEGERQWVYSNPGRLQLLFIWGHMRKFSFVSDPSAFGLLMAFCGLGSFVLMLGPFQAIYKFLFGICSVVMFLSMSYSGTRTAVAMVAVGIVFYIVVTLRSRKTIMVMMAAAIGGFLILFGPFHGGTLNRIRSTFNTEEDVSMGVRDRKRIKLQSYIQGHPFGGGINTVATNGAKYSMGHELIAIGDPDSGYLLTALEQGWIGLLIGLGFFFSVMVKGINNYHALHDPVLKTITLTYIVPFMGLSVAHFTQDAMFAKPVYLVIIATYALMLRLPAYEKSKLNNS